MEDCAMASPLVGALFFGMVSSGPALPVRPFFAQGLPTPQCVQCGPGNRYSVASLHDWSNAEAKARYMREVEGRAAIDPRALMMDRQLGMTEQQVQHLTRFAGV